MVFYFNLINMNIIVIYIRQYKNINILSNINAFLTLTVAYCLQQKGQNIQIILEAS